ncbi:hypothetical protein ACGFZK_09175 [Streptomyces sp. NPDC048257]|uniref:hypothetical protein n=1 Tax=Streptomyces sp. NPDC048257 TaxID=3365526 RepID=UPI00371E3F74
MRGSLGVRAGSRATAPAVWLVDCGSGRQLRCPADSAAKVSGSSSWAQVLRVRPSTSLRWASVTLIVVTSWYGSSNSSASKAPAAMTESAPVRDARRDPPGHRGGELVVPAEGS